MYITNEVIILKKFSKLKKHTYAIKISHVQCAPKVRMHLQKKKYFWKFDFQCFFLIGLLQRQIMFSTWYPWFVIHKSMRLAKCMWTRDSTVVSIFHIAFQF